MQFNLHNSLISNKQKRAVLKNRFSGWVKGSKPRIIYSDEMQRYTLNWMEPVWTITNIVQLAERAMQSWEERRWIDVQPLEAGR